MHLQAQIKQNEIFGIRDTFKKSRLLEHRTSILSEQLKGYTVCAVDKPMLDVVTTLLLVAKTPLQLTPSS